jgi:hypothetical protein
VKINILTPNVVKYATGEGKSVILSYSKACIPLGENYKEYVKSLLISSLSGTT